MTRLLLGMALVAATLTAGPSLAIAGHSGEVVIDGYRLPVDHRFESPDASGKRHVVNINDVPSLIKQGRAVFDKTANVWVNSPKGTVNKQYLASASKPESPSANPPSGSRWDRIRGTVQNVSGKAVTVRTDDNRTITVDTSQVRSEASGLKPGDRVIVGGEIDQSNRVTARYLREEATAGSLPADQGQWQRVHGQVQSVEGSKLRFRTDDGRVLNVDMSAVGPETRRSLTKNEGATLIGFPGSGNQFRAEYIQQDTSDPSRGGRIGGQPVAPPAQAKASSGKGSQRVHGQIGAIGGTTLDLKTDDGRTLVVDVGQVDPDTVKSLTGGERVTVTGSFRGPTRLDAQQVQKDGPRRP
jgi:hypothetical protein